jgi:hypothetical protein
VSSLVSRALVLWLLVAVVLAGCDEAPSRSAPLTAGATTSPRAPQNLPVPAPPAPPTATLPIPTLTAPAPTTAAAPALAPSPAPPARPAWLGTRPLPLRPDGFAVIEPTPPELRDRRLPPPNEALAPPLTDAFAATISTVPAEVAARSTWGPHCPVALADLRYVTVTFWGFNERAHTGELLVHASAADDLVDVFGALYAARFPIEEMRVVAPAELDAAPTGDGNNTSAFVCRATTAGSSWSQHAYGLAVDVNPFHNPYRKRELVVPELASAYVDRVWRRPGMVVAGDAVTTAFAAIGWGWGGDWRSASDWMHFSANGR